MTNLSVDEFLGDDVPQPTLPTPAQRPAYQPDSDAAVQVAPDSLGPVLLSLFACDDVLEGIHSKRLAFSGVRFEFSFDAFPAAFNNQLITTVWRLPEGHYALEVGLLDFTGALLASSLEERDQEQPTVYISTHRLVDVPLDLPGIYWLAARCNGQLVSTLPIGVEERS